MVEGEGFEPSKAEPTDLQSAPFDRSGTPPKTGNLVSNIFLEIDNTVTGIGDRAFHTRAPSYPEGIGARGRDSSGIRCLTIDGRRN